MGETRLKASPLEQDWFKSSFFCVTFAPKPYEFYILFLVKTYVHTDLSVLVVTAKPSVFFFIYSASISFPDEKPLLSVLESFIWKALCNFISPLYWSVSNTRSKTFSLYYARMSLTISIPFSKMSSPLFIYRLKGMLSSPGGTPLLSLNLDKFCLLFFRLQQQKDYISKQT